MRNWLPAAALSSLVAMTLAACASPPADGLYTIEGVVDLAYDQSCCDEDTYFRIAFMVVPGDGGRIEDFFDGIPVEEGVRTTHEGNARYTVFRHPEVDPARTLGASWDAIVYFQEDFPDHIGRDFDLTFKLFEGNRFQIEGAPLGRYYIWIQTRFDGNRWFQLPVLREPAVTGPRTATMDIFVESSAAVFHTL